MAGEVLGIDLGTTNSVMAFIEMDEPTIIENIEGRRTTPSIVYFREDGECVVGEIAKRNLVANPDRTVKSIKRHMGTDFRVEIDGEGYPPEYISAHILKRLVRDAEEVMDRRFRDAVITVPAYFTDAQRQATKDAGEIAGLNVKRIINEPTAAALAYGFREDDEKTILVYDFGGGTFDVSILMIGGGFFDVDATSGDNHLGGDDIDERIADFLIKKIKKKYKKNVRKDLALLQTLREASENAKIQLSSMESTTINLPYIGRKHGSPIAFSYELTRQEFNGLIKDFIERTKKPMERALKDASLEPEDIDDIILVGGSTKIPAVQEFVEEFFGKIPNKKTNPDEVVALGAAICSIEDVKSNIKVEISDVISRSLGIETADGTVAKILERNTKIPIAKTKRFTNPRSFMDEVIIPVYQGEELYPNEEGFLGEFWVSIEPKPVGTSKIDVSFEIGREFGILDVTAFDHDSGNKRRVKLEAKGRLSKQEKNRWMKRLSRLTCVEVEVENTVTRDVLTLQLNPYSTIGDVKNDLMRKGILSEGASLFSEGEELREDLTVSEINIGATGILNIDEVAKNTVSGRQRSLHKGGITESTS